MPVAQYPTNIADILSSNNRGAIEMIQQQQNNANLAEMLSRQKAQQDYDLQQQKTPYELEKLGLENTGLGLANEGLGYTNRQSAVKANTDEALQKSNIRKNLSANEAAMSLDKVKQMGAMAEHANQIADLVESGQVPLLAVAGKLPPELAQVLAQPGGTQRLRQWAGQVATHSAGQLQKMQEVNANNASAERRNSATNSTNLTIQREAIQAGKYDKKSAQSWFEKFQSAKTPRESYTIASNQALLAEQGGDMESAAKWQQLANHAADAWQNELRTGQKPGIDPAATANTGSVVPSPQSNVPKFDNAQKPDPLGIR